MTFRQEIGQSSQAVDLNQRIGQLAGYGIVDGGEPSIGSRPFAIDFRQVTTIINGETITLDATSVDLEDYAIPSEARKAVIYIAPSESGEGGEYRVAAGEPSRPKPEGAVRFDTFEPAPPDLSSIDAVPLAEVWLGANAQQLIDEDYRDRRFESVLTPRHLTAQRGSFEAVIDGAGVRHEDGLGDAGATWEDLDILEVVNSDPNHGADATHTYFSGSHDLLSEVGTGDHHTRRTDTEDRDAVRGSLDAADLAGDLADTPGTHLGVPDGVDTQWVRPPRAEAPVVASGTDTHTGGSDTTIIINDVAPSQIATLDVAVSENAPTWDADYAYSTSISSLWNSTSQTNSIELTLSWTNDPGSGNDLEVEYSIWDMDPMVVTDLYDNQDAAAALQGATIDPAVIAVAAELEIPVYDTLPTSASLGDTVISTGNETSAWGIYQHDGTDWNGPYTAGLTALSELTIDIDKDWAGEPITNVGDPIDPGDMLTLGTITAHADDEAAHHAPTTSSDIDHSQMMYVRSDQHHPPLTGEAVGDVLSGQLIEVSTTTAQIPTDDAARVHAVVDDDERVEVLRGEVSDDSGSTPSGLRLEIAELDTDTLLYSQDTQIATGTLAEPLVQIPGPRSLDIRVYNDTGGTAVASGGVSYRLNPLDTVYGDRIVMMDDTGTKEVSERQGVVVDPHTELAGVRAEISDQVSGYTTAYIQESGGGEILAEEDITHLDPGQEIELRASRAIQADERVYVSIDADGDTYTRGRGNDSGQFPYTSSDFDVVEGVYSISGALSDSNRYNVDEITAIRLE